MWFNGQITSWNIYLNWKRFWHVAFSNSLIIHKECNECLEISWKTAHFLHPKFFLLKLFPLTSNIKHSAQCFFTRWNISRLVKNTPLRVVFSTLFSVFHLRLLLDILHQINASACEENFAFACGFVVLLDAKLVSFIPSSLFSQDQQAKVGGLTPIRSIFAWHFTTAECTEKKMKEDLIFRPSFRWCCTGRQATTIFSATQRCNVGTTVQPFETISQQYCNTVLR